MKLDLGRYVIVRPRTDGSSRVLFEVPARLRPSGWLPTIPLPVAGPWVGDLTDAAEVARIQQDAGQLFRQLEQARRGTSLEDPKDRSLARLIRAWQSSQRYKHCKPRTQKGYQQLADEIARTYATLPRPFDLASMNRDAVERFLAIYDNRPSLRLSVFGALRLIMDQAIALGWRSDNPCVGISVPKPESRVTVWEGADVDRYIWGAALAGQWDLAGLILMEWEIGQRLTDAILFRRGAEYSVADGAFRFWQSKTQAWVSVPVSDRLRAILAVIEREGSLYLFHDAVTGRPFPDVDRLGHVFTAVRALVVKAGGRRLVLRALRHSCVVQLGRAECTVPEIASITGHSISSAAKILKTYLPRDSVMAWNAQTKRGLIG